MPRSQQADLLSQQAKVTEILSLLEDAKKGSAGSQAS